MITIRYDGLSSYPTSSAQMIFQNTIAFLSLPLNAHRYDRGVSSINPTSISPRTNPGQVARRWSPSIVRLRRPTNKISSVIIPSVIPQDQPRRSENPKSKSNMGDRLQHAALLSIHRSVTVVLAGRRQPVGNGDRSTASANGPASEKRERKSSANSTVPTWRVWHHGWVH
jgi:hypothetical protein